MLETSLKHTTPTDQIIINVKGMSCQTKDLTSFENKKQFNDLCEIGCPNFNKKWACPPHSPSYSQYSKSYSHINLLLFYCNLDQFYYTKTDYMKVKAANSILKSKLDKFLRKLEPIFDGTMLSNGSCRLCKPCSAKENSQGCKRPEQMRFSLEALGLDVNQISLKFFNHELLWYKDKQAPRYTSVIGCLLTNKPVDEKILEEQLSRFISTSISQSIPLIEL